LGTCEASRWFALPVAFLLVSVLLFFGTLNRHEFYSTEITPARMAGDLLMVTAAVLGFYSLGLYLLHRPSWNRVAAVALGLSSLSIIISAYPIRHPLSSVLAGPAFQPWKGLLVGLLEDAALILWIALSASPLIPRAVRRRRMALTIGVAFLVVSICGIALGTLFLGSEWIFNWRTEVASGVVGPSFWDAGLGHAAWFFLLLFLIPVTSVGMTVFREGDAGRTNAWIRMALISVPALVLIGMLARLSVGSYTAPSLRFWPILVSSFACLLHAPALIGRFKGQEIRVVALAASLSILALGFWMWIRGPSLGFFPDSPVLTSLWRVSLRRLVPASLMLAGLVGAGVAALAPVRHGPLGTIGAVSTGGPRGMFFTPLLISAALLLGLAAEFILRIWMSYRTLFPPVSSFPQTILVGTGTVLAASIILWRFARNHSNDLASLG
jgi:hypothetical protein